MKKITFLKLKYILSAFIFSIIFYSSNTKAQGALDFDGSNDYISIPASPSLDNLTSATFEAWVYWRGGYNLFMKGGYGYGIGLNYDIEWWQQFSQGAGPNSTGPQKLTLNAWNHVAVTIVDGGDLKFYINGVKVTNQNSSTGSIVKNAGQALYIGTQGSCLCNYMSMQLDEFRIWNVVKTEAEIQSSMYAPLSGSHPNLVAYYDFEEGTGSVLTDKSGNGNNGTLHNMDNSDWVSGNYGSSSITIDTTKPVITLLGDNPQVIEVGTAYSELNATASDNLDGNISGNIVIDASDVDTNVVDTYTVTYNVTDAAGNVADQVTRTVNVVDTTKPVITLLGDASVSIEVGSSYVDLGVTVSDNYDSNITASLVTDLTDVNINIVDSYTVTYNVTDANGNVADEVTRTINVVDTTKPVITLVGDNPQILEYNEVYSELGATATDNYDDNTALTATINIDAAAAIAGASDGNTFGTLGTYNVTYNVTDANGNVADEVTRTVEVVDTTKPVLTLLGDNPQLIEIISGNDAVYVELGATASDEFDLDVDDADIVIDTSALTPNLGNVGCYPVVYSVTDASGNTRTRTRTVFVLEQGKPWAKDDSYTVSQDSQNNELRIINNDSYGTDGANADDKLALIGTYTDNGGKIDLIAETYVLYTPRTGFFGTDSFTYTITDATGDASVATVTITVTQDFAPTAVDDVVTVLENSGLTTINVLANDDFGGNNAHAVTPLTLPSATTAEGGTVVVNAGQVDYTPAADFSGLDSFTYTIKDTDGDTATGTVLITVTVDDSFIPQTPPVAQPDVASVYQNSAGNIIYVLVNDDFGSDGAIDEGLTLPNGTLLGDSDKLGTVSIDTNSTPGTSDDVILYTPKSGFVGEDSFKYMITDANGDTSITIVTVTVTELSVPTAVADAVIVVQDSGVTSINVLANDGYGSDGVATSDALTLPSATSTQGGTVVVNAGQVDYTPASGFTGQDTFTYVIKDLDGDTSTATVTVTVTSISSASVPTAQDDAVSFTQNSTDNIISILLDNGSGADDFGADNANATHPISLSGSYTDLGGKIDLVGTTVKYSPRTDFVGVDVFSYTITDSNGDSSTAEVTVTVTEITTPTAVDDVASTTEDSGAISIDVLANDSYGFDGAASSDALTLPSVTSTQGGTVVVNAGEVDYTPSSGFFGTDTFDYTIKDDTGDTSTATVTVTVTEAVVVNDMPTAQDDVVVVLVNTTDNDINILDDNGNGVDVYGTDGANATHPISLFGAYTDKGAKIDLVGNIVKYTPAPSFVGVDKFSYMITDGNGDSSTAEVTVNVNVSRPSDVTDNDNVILKELQVYPNPSEGDVNIIVSSKKTDKVRVVLFDVTGKVVYQNIETLSEGENRINFNINAKSGILMLKVFSDATNYGTRKVVFK